MLDALVSRIMLFSMKDTGSLSHLKHFQWEDCTSTLPLPDRMCSNKDLLILVLKVELKQLG